MAATTVCPWLISANAGICAWFSSCLDDAGLRASDAPAIFAAVDDLVASPGADAVIYLDLTNSNGAIDDLLQQTRRQAPEIPLIALVSGVEAGARSLDAGADDYLIPAETGAALFARATRYAQEQRPKRAQAEHERYRLFLENAPDIIFVIDLGEQRVTYINRDHLFGYTPDELSQHGAIFELIHTADHASVLQHWKELSTASAGDVFVSEYRVRRKRGDWEWVQSRETVLFAAAYEQSPQILVSLSIITNRREREAAVRRYAERLHILHEIDQAIVAARSPQAIAQSTLRRITRLLSCRRASVVIFNWEQNTFTIVAELPEGSMGSDDSSSLPLDWFWALDELKQGELFRAEDLSQLAPEVTTQLLLWLQGQGVHSLVSVPLLAQKQLIGALNFGGEFVDSFTPEDIVVMREVAHVLAIGIGQARLYEQAHYHARKLEQRARRLLLVNDISLALNRPVDLIAVLEEAAKGLVAVIDLRQVGIVLLNERRSMWSLLVSYSARRGGSLQRLEVDIPDRELVQQLLQEDSFIYVDDATRETRIAGLQDLLLEHDLDNLMLVPLQVRDEVIGIIGCDLGPGVRPFSREETDLVQTIANLLSVKIEQIRLLEAERSARSEAEAHAASLRQRERDLTLLNSVTRATTGLQMEEMLQTVVERLGESSGARGCYISLWDEAQQHTLPAAAYGPLRDSYTSYKVNPDEETLTRTVLEVRHSLQVASTGSTPFVSSRIATDLGPESALAIPLLAGKDRLGAVIITYEEPYEFSQAEVALYEQAASQIALALSAARLFEETRRQLEELKVLHALATAGAEAGSEDTLLERATQLMKESLFPDNFGVLLYDEKEQTLYRHHSYYSGHHQTKEIDIPLNVGICGHVVRTGQSILIGNVIEDERYVASDPQTRSELCVPLKTGAHVIGVVNVESKEVNAYSEVDERLLSTFAHQLATAIENARLFAETRRRAEELEVLGNLSASLRVADGADEIIASLMSASAELFEAEAVAIMVPGDAPGTLITSHSIGLSQSLKEFVYETDSSIAGHVFATGKPYRSQNILEDGRRYRASLQLWNQQSFRPQTAVYAPLQAGSQVIGIVSVITGTGHILDEEDLDLLTAMAEITGSALHRAGLMETLEQRVVERTRELADANEQLKELDRLKSKFVSDVSHELRTPITSLSLYLDLIESGNPERNKRYWAVLRKQTERLNHLIEDILSLSRLQMGKIEVSLVPIDLNELVAEVLEMRRDDFAAANLGLEFQADETLPSVSAQPDLLAQVVANLLSNALNYTQEGAVWVSTSFDSGHNMACVSIADSGIGINAGDLPHIFERFYRGHFAGQSNIPGTGLGLTIVEEIVHLHNGHIEVDSEEGAGTTFRVWLPFATP